MKLADIATALGARLEGDGNLNITGVTGIEEAEPGQITFVSNPKYAAAAKTTRASAVIVDEAFPAISAATLRCKNPYLAFAHAIDLFYQAPRYAPGVHPTAVLHPTAKIGANAHIAAYVVIDENVVIGDNAVLLPHVVIYRGVKIGKDFFAHAHSVVREFCELGDGVILQNGVIVGADGFGFAKNDQGKWEKIAQSGPTILEDKVEIQANACVDRASVGETRIKSGAKIDNFVQVGHGSSVGENTLICSQTGLAGSTEVGNNVILAGQVGVAGHCTIGNGVVVYAQSGIHGDIPDGSVLSGSPAFDARQWLRATTAYNKLPELVRAIRALEKAVAEIREAAKPKAASETR
jgi:UDP-3-O-[3-hydroxymyristoyl] glucosamine N-acyltransferase